MLQYFTGDTYSLSRGALPTLPPGACCLPMQLQMHFPSPWAVHLQLHPAATETWWGCR